MVKIKKLLNSINQNNQIAVRVIYQNKLRDIISSILLGMSVVVLILTHFSLFAQIIFEANILLFYSMIIYDSAMSKVKWQTITGSDVNEEYFTAINEVVTVAVHTEYEKREKTND